MNVYQLQNMNEVLVTIENIYKVKHIKATYSSSIRQCGHNNLVPHLTKISDTHRKKAT